MEMLFKIEENVLFVYTSEFVKVFNKFENLDCLDVFQDQNTINIVLRDFDFGYIPFNIWKQFEIILDEIQKQYDFIEYHINTTKNMIVIDIDSEYILEY